MNQSERLKALITELLETPNSFAIGIGLSTPATIYAVINNGRPISQKLLKKIIDAYPNLNPEWILNGTFPKLLTSKKEDGVAEERTNYEILSCKVCLEKDKEIMRLNNKLIELHEQYLECLKELSEQKKTASG